MMMYPRKVAIGFQEGTCPLKCPKCFAFNGKTGRKKTVHKMPASSAIQLIDEIAGWEQKPVIQPHIFTEPFANQELGEIMRYIHKQGMSMSTITNGILLNTKWMDFILSECSRKDTITFSLDALSQEIYEKVRGKYSLAELEDKIEYLLKHRTDSLGSRIGVSYTVEQENYKDVGDFIDKWKYKVDFVRVDVALDENKKIPERFRKSEVKDISACGLLDEVMTIDADGHVRACQYDAFGDSDFGNVFEEGVLEIWRGTALERHRTKQRKGELNTSNFCFGCEGIYCTKLTDRNIGDVTIREAAYVRYYNRTVKVN